MCSCKNINCRACFLADVKYMFVVGGFAESLILQASLRREFGHILRILIPQEVGLVILKGNLLMISP